MKEFDEEKREVHIYVKARKTAKYPCPECGKLCERYDDEEERVWQHGDVVFFPCNVHCKRPRIKCDGYIHVVGAPWARARSRFTLLFESYAMLILKSMTINEACTVLRISNTVLTNIQNFYVEQAIAKDDLSNVEQISIDETSHAKGQRYVTVICDSKARGFKTFCGYRNMIFRVCGKRKLDTVPLFG